MVISIKSPSKKFTAIFGIQTQTQRHITLISRSIGMFWKFRRLWNMEISSTFLLYIRQLLYYQNLTGISKICHGTTEKSILNLEVFYRRNMHSEAAYDQLAEVPYK